MRSVRARSLLAQIAALLAIALVPSAAAAAGPASRAVRSPESRLGTHQATFSIPLSFEPNAGQANPTVKFLARANGAAIFIESDQLDLVLAGRSTRSSTASAAPAPRTRFDASVSIRLVNANPDAVVRGEGALRGRVNYFLGNDPRRWHTNIPTFGAVVVHDAWPGVDVRYNRASGAGSNDVECSFLAKPRTDLSAIRIAFGGSGPARLRSDGNIAVQLGSRRILFTAPRVFEENGSNRSEVRAGFVAKPSRAGARELEVGIQVARRDPASRLLIDPTLVYSTYLGGSGLANNETDFAANGDVVQAIALDSAGNEYLAGGAESTDFPSTNNSFLAGCPGGNPCYPAFVTKLDARSGAIVYSTFLGSGSGDPGPGQGPGDRANAIAVDKSGQAYVAGMTWSSSFPTTAGALVANCQSCSGIPFVIKLSADGSSLVYSTLLEPNGHGDSVNAVAIDEVGQAYVTGVLNRATLAAVLNPTGSALTYGVLLAASTGNAVAVSPDHRMFIGGQAGSEGGFEFPTTANAYKRRFCQGCVPAFVAVLDPSLGSTRASLLYSTVLGNLSDAVNGIAVDGRGRAWAVGIANDCRFPGGSRFGTHKKCTRKWSSAAFLSIINPSRSGRASLNYSGVIGGNGADGANAIALDDSGDAYIGGQTSSTDFPVTPNAIQATYTPCEGCAGYRAAGFVMIVKPGKPRPIYSTYLGGATVLPPTDIFTQKPRHELDAVNGIAIDALGHIHAAGLTFAAGFPVTTGALEAQCKACTSMGSDGFVTRIDPRAQSGQASLLYSSFLGGAGARYGGDVAYAIAMDGSGAIYVAGLTSSVDFPVSANAFQTSSTAAALGSAPQSLGYTAFVSKLDPAAAPDQQLIYSTYLGGSRGDWATALAVDPAGEAYVAGATQSSDFPVTPTAFRAAGTNADVFFTKLDSTGSQLIYSTAIGGGVATGVAVDPAGNALIGGATQDTSYPTTSGALQSACNPCGADSDGGFFSKINPAKSGNASLVYSTFLSGSQPAGVGNSDLVLAVASDSAGRAVLTGTATATDFPVTSNAFQPHDPGNGPSAFVTVIDPALSGSSQLTYSTYFNGYSSLGGSATWGNAVMADTSGKLYLGGYNYGGYRGTNLPTSPNAFASTCPTGITCGSGFIAVFDPQAAPANQLVYGTFLGGGNDNPRVDDAITALGLDSNGRIYAAGHTFSKSFPVTPDAVQPTCISCPVHKADEQGNQGFLAVLDPSMTGANQLVYSTYLGGSNFDGVTALAMGPSGRVALAGYSSSPDFPVAGNAFQGACRACRNAWGEGPYPPNPFALPYLPLGQLYGNAFVSLFQF